MLRATRCPIPGFMAGINKSVGIWVVNNRGLQTTVRVGSLIELTGKPVSSALLLHFNFLYLQKPLGSRGTFLLVFVTFPHNYSKEQHGTCTNPSLQLSSSHANKVLLVTSVVCVFQKKFRKILAHPVATMLNGTPLCLEGLKIRLI